MYAIYYVPPFGIYGKVEKLNRVGFLADEDSEIAEPAAKKPRTRTLATEVGVDGVDICLMIDRIIGVDIGYFLV